MSGGVGGRTGAIPSARPDHSYFIIKTRAMTKKPDMFYVNKYITLKVANQLGIN
jgi:hypothetical protein